MRKFTKLITAVCIALFIAVQTALPILAADMGRLESIFSDSMESRGADSFYEGLKFGQADWIAICRLRLFGREGAEEYISEVKSAADDLMSQNGFVRPTELQRAAILLSFAGECPDTLTNAAVYQNENLDRQGFNAYLWGLIAINCTNSQPPDNALNTKESITEYILSKQLTDGGFSLKGSAADTDITAATIYALAPMKEDEKVSAALKRAEQCLADLQLENGGYMTVGVENCESSAQAIIAFSALGYDESDSRVEAAYKAMEKYTCDGGYAHFPDGEVNGTATVQAAQAITALLLAERGEALFSAPTDIPTDVPSDESTTEESVSEPQPEKIEEKSNTLSGGQIKLIIVVGLFGISAVTLVVFLILGRKKTALLWAAVVFAVVGAVVCFVDIRTPEEYYSDRADEDGISVTLSVECGTAIANMDRIDTAVNPPDVIPADGIVIYPSDVTVPNGGTAFDALISAAKSDRIQVDYNGTSYGLYINGIGHIYEFGFGSSSGWLYKVNGEFPQMSAGAYKLSDGDVVEFVYTCEMGDVRGFSVDEN